MNKATKHTINQEHFELLKYLSKESNISQRKLSNVLGLSLGKLNYLIKQLTNKNFIKIHKEYSKNNKNKYQYTITHEGTSAKKYFALNFLNENLSELDSDDLKKKKIKFDYENLKHNNKNFGIGHNSKNNLEISVDSTKRSKPLYKTIEINIKRRKIIVDDVLSTYKNFPIPSWIELSIIDVCNRTCSFCPKSNPKIAPDTYQRMNLNLIEKLTKELIEINYKGSVTLCGYGEPMLHKEVNLISKTLSEAALIEIVTNGDTLKAKQISELYENNVNKLLISMYDGEHQIEKFQKIIKDSGVPDEFVILRDRWYDSNKDYGIKLTNRSGTINIGEQEKIGKYKKCFYPSYQFLIDWNGDVFLCPQDWQRRVTMGNMMQEDIYSIWSGKIMSKYRKQLLSGKRTSSPCNSCNAQGTLLGQNHEKIWREIYRG